ncbi:MAG: hypothetical protein PWP08_775 [Methanofollis sp.]|nr:hypothetical protein [Methanofollis sp.]
MRSAIKIIIWLFAVFCLIQAASASVNYKVTGTPDVNPASGDLSPGESVTVNVVLDLVDSGSYTFPEDHRLALYTELSNPVWRYYIEVGGHSDQPRALKGYSPQIDGFILSYPEDTDVSVRIALSGDAPTATATQDKVLLRIRQIDDDDDVVDDSEYIIKRTVVNPQDVQADLAATQASLTELKASIDEQLAAGVDTTAAQAKYDAAKAAINSASATSDFAAAKNYLTTAKTAIAAATAALSQAEAQKEIDDAQTAINQIDGIITYFEVNRSMGTDQRVLNLKTQRDLAAQALSAANDQMSAGNYEAAAVKGADASEKAQSTLTLATQLREEIGGGFSLNLGSLPLYIGVGVLIVVIIVGIIYIRKKKRWDELG